VAIFNSLLGSGSCFGDVPEAPDDPMAFLGRLERVISERMATRPEGSYTAKLLAGGWSRIAQKVGEEGIEAALAGAGGSDHEVIEEVSDLLYHVMVMLKARGLALERVIGELRERHEARG
jgi:phosphoribosyl-AMP cyclohydrolase / phosphoribosyl-ATP pyrophosphohydrolase